jgi:hypothetical protein
MIFLGCSASWEEVGEARLLTRGNSCIGAIRVNSTPSKDKAVSTMRQIRSTDDLKRLEALASRTIVARKPQESLRLSSGNLMMRMRWKNGANEKGEVTMYFISASL